jgi:signal transduction histidine kinase
MVYWREKRNQNRASAKSKVKVSHASVLQRDRILWRAAIESLADISDLPLTILKILPIEELFDILRRKSLYFSSSFQNIDEFRKFVADANANPLAIMRQLSSSANEWRSVFESLSQNITIGPSARQEPVLRLLRYHWSWRWTELLAVCDSLWNRNADRIISGLYDCFAPGVLLCELIELDQSAILMIGPIKNKQVPPQLCAKELKGLVQKFYEAGGNQLGPVHPIERYEQFFYDRPAIYSSDLLNQKRILQDAIRLSNAIEWPVSHAVDYFDITAASEFAYCLADIAHNPLGYKFKSYRKDLSISYSYPLYLGTDQRRTRQLRYRAVETSTGYNESVTFANVRTEPNSSALFSIGKTATPEEGKQQGAINSLLNRHFEEGARRRRITQSQRFLEELLILRYRLADNFGVLTSGYVEEAGPPGVDFKLGQRISRTVTEVCHCDSAVIYRYDHLNNLLYSVGVSVDDGNTKPLGRQDYQWMEDVGRNENRKKRSVAYTAAERDCVVQYNESSEFKPLAHNNSTKVNPPRGSRLIPGKSIVAVPIRVFDRLWGVFEVHSRHSNSFSYPHLEWLAKIADLVGPYYHEQIVMNTLYRIASTNEALGDRDNQFNALARQAAGIFLCNTACVWIRDLVNTDQYNCVGFTGRADLERRVSSHQALPIFSSQSERSVARDAIEKKKIWIEGAIGTEPFDRDWLNKEHTRSLLLSGYKYIAIMPIYDLERNAIAVISVYSRHRPFSSKWENWATYIGNYMGVVITRVHNAREIEAQLRSLVAHEITNAAETVKDAAQNITTFVNQLPRRIRPRDAFNWISDIQTHVGDIETAVSDWVAGRETKKARRSQAMLLATAQQRSKIIPIPVNVRTEFNACIAPLHRQMRRRGIVYHINFPKGGLLLKMHAEDFRMIFNNLVRNAFKYSPSNERIEFEFTQQAFGMRISVSNYGLSLAKGESLRVFDLGFRGKSVKDKYSGSGLGLYLVKKLCEFYGIGVRYESNEDDAEGRIVQHRVDLDFPAKIVMTAGSTGH